MAELTWQSILKSQQHNFIRRLKFSYDSRQCSNDFLRFSTLNLIDESCVPVAGHNSEIVELDFCDEHENEIDEFCCEMVDKYMDNNLSVYPDDSYTSYKIGKLGEEAVKVYLGDLINEVNYGLSEYGDGGVDFISTRNPEIKIQVKTSCIKRITYYIIGKWELTEEEIIDTLQPPEEYYFGKINNSWSISSEESEKNDILICVLFLNSIDCDRIINDTYRFLMAGFIPVEKKAVKRKFKIDELLYMGGLKGHLEFL